VSLRARLTLWFLVLALVPTLVLSVFVLRQLVSTVEWWDSAGAEEALTSSVSVARTALKRLEAGLRLSTAPLFELSRTRALALEPGQPDRMFIERYLRDTGLDLYQLYTRTPGDSTWRLVADVAPLGVTRAEAVDLGPELTAGRLTAERPVQSVTGAFGLLEILAPDSTTRVERAVLAGYALPEDFFLRLSELQLGIAIFGRLSVYADVYKWYYRILVALVLVAVSALAVFAARALARHVARPIASLADTFARVGAGTRVHVEPEGAPEVQRLGEAFNAMTERLDEARIELARAERSAAWQDVARQVAHEIKNPLTTIGLALEVMSREFDKLPEESRARVQRGVLALRRDVDSLADLAESFHTLGRMPEVRPGAVDLNALVESVIAASPWQHVTITAEVDPERPVARGDERQLRRVLRNLVKNACEAQPGGGAVTVSTRAANDGAGAVSFTVKDEGPGMPEDVRARMFEPGYSTKQRGSGVGLAVTRRIVEQHGGAIDVDSAPGAGTRITIRLPAYGSTAEIGPATPEESDPHE
jgi:nitrogen fixation/metabolism regulation signal transduction histidine kinase